MPSCQFVECIKKKLAQSQNMLTALVKENKNTEHKIYTHSKRLRTATVVDFNHSECSLTTVPLLSD